MSRSTAIITWCAAIVALGIWSFFAFRSVSECVELEQARSWPTVPGAVTSATVTERSGRKGKRTFMPVVRYTYITGQDKTEFAASRIHARSPSSGSSRAANAVIARYPLGAQVKVYVDPSRPDNAMLEPGMRPDDWMELTLFGAALFGVMGLLATAWHFSRRLGPGYVAGMRVREGATIRVRGEACGALAGGCYFSAVLALAGCGVGKVLGEFSVLWLVGIMLTGAVVALLIWILITRAAESPSDAELSLDYDKEIVTSPKMSGFKPEIISMASITGTAINAVTSFNGKTKTTVYQVHLSDAERTNGPVAAVFSSERPAKVFETWLREQLALTDG